MAQWREHGRHIQSIEFRSGLLSFNTRMRSEKEQPGHVVGQERAVHTSDANLLGHIDEHMECTNCPYNLKQDSVI